VFGDPLRQLGARFSAMPRTAFFTTWPLSGILSQESTVNGGRPRSRRRERFNQNPGHRLRQRRIFQIVNNARLRQVQHAAGGSMQ
jgi:hypothetical protein